MTRHRPLLGVVLASIALNALLGIYALLAPHFGSVQWKVLGTSACVTGAGVLALACLPALEQRRLRILPLVGIAASVLGFALAVLAIWTGGGVGLGKTVGSVLAVAAACVLPSLLALLTLAPRYRWSFRVAGGLSLLLAALIVAAIWSEPSGAAFPRVIGVVAVLLASLTVAIPVLHRVSRAGPETGAAAVRFCPACGAEVSPGPDGVALCAACGARFRVDYRPAGG